MLLDLPLMHHYYTYIQISVEIEQSACAGRTVVSWKSYFVNLKLPFHELIILKWIKIPTLKSKKSWSCV